MKYLVLCSAIVLGIIILVHLVAAGHPVLGGVLFQVVLLAVLWLIFRKENDKAT